ncbi:MAG: aminopeptidase [Breznakia sp.]
MNQKLLEKYAKLAVVSGVNVQKGQSLVINAPINTNDLVEKIVEEAYKVGAKEVLVHFYNEKISRLHYEYQDVDTLTTIPTYTIEQKTAPIREGACVLHVISEIPEVMAGIDPKKISSVAIARQKAFKELSEITMASKVQWSIIGYPNMTWAKKVFPKDNEKIAYQKLETVILESVHVLENNDPIDAWLKHDAALRKYVDTLNAYNFKTLHFKNTKGTDIHIDLVRDHIWAGGEEYTPNKIMFNANMPTEEVFCMPHKLGVNGTVVSSKPLSYNGSLINEFTLTFKDGKVVKYHAKNNEEVLKTLIEFDEGSCYIGEVALVPYHSPISMSNILYYNTLYDENASCHLALGRAYPMNVKGGSEMSQEELDTIGSNNSMTHVDFMFGSADMEVVGITQEDKEIPIFKNGNFAF